MIKFNLIKASLAIIFIFFSIKSFSQTKISGLILNTNDSIVPSINITLESNKRVISYAYSKDNGKYNLETKATGIFQLNFSGLGYKKNTINIEILDDSKEIIIDQVLQEKSFNLDEVIIASEKPVIIKKDTIIFNVKPFKKGNEEVVEDILKNLPGVEVGEDGSIKVGGKEIEKVMVEGDDFFEKGYQILTKNMPSQDIEKVEVFQKYSNSRLLKGIEDSDKVAINLKLKEGAKRQWFGNVNIKQGISSFNRYELKSNLINLGKINKYYFLTNLNNIGNDPVGDVNHLIRPTNRNQPSSIGENHKIRKINDLVATVPNISDRRTNFNNAELISLNAIFNPNKKLKIKSLVFFNSDTRDFFRNQLDNFLFNQTNFTNSEDYQLTNKEERIFGKLSIKYRISRNEELDLITKYNHNNENEQSNLLFNGISTLETLSSKNQLFDQKIVFTNKFEDTKVLLLTGRLINEKLPQQYNVNRFLYQELFPEINDGDNVLQDNINKMTFVGFEAHLLNRKKNEDLFELKLGNEYKKESLLSAFSILQNSVFLNSPDEYQNDTRYITNNLYVKSKYLLHLNKLDVIGKLGIHSLHTNVKFNGGASQVVSPFFINPTIGLKWNLNENNKITSSYSYNTTNTDIVDVSKNFSLNNYRSFSKGLGGFNQLDVSRVNIKYRLGDWSDDFFANVSIFYSKNHDFISTNSSILQNFSQIEKIIIKDRSIFNIASSADRYIDMISANVKIKFSYSKSNFKNIVNDSNLREVSSENFNYGIELRSGFKGIFNYHIGTRWTNSIIQTTFKNSFTDIISFIDASFSFNEKLNFDIKSERYFFGNLTKSDNTYYFLDLNSKYKIKKKNLSLTLQARNLSNTEIFRSSSISDIGTFTTAYRLLPRFILLGMNYSF